MKFKTFNKINTEFSMSSLTDVVFLLLIFFMLTSSSVKGLDINLPNAKGNPKNLNTDVYVSIDKAGLYYVGEKMVIEQDLNAEIESVTKNTQNPTIVIRAEKSIPMQKVVAVMNIANRLNYKVVLAVDEK